MPGGALVVASLWGQLASPPVQRPSGRATPEPARVEPKTVAPPKVQPKAGPGPAPSGSPRVQHPGGAQRSQASEGPSPLTGSGVVPPPAPHLGGRGRGARVGPALGPSALELPAPILGQGSYVFLGSGVVFMGAGVVFAAIRCGEERCRATPERRAAVGTLASMGAGLILISAILLSVDTHRSRERAVARERQLSLDARGLHF